MQTAAKGGLGCTLLVRCERVAFDRIHARIRREQELDQTVP
jgi:hypothetical protein